MSLPRSLFYFCHIKKKNCCHICHNILDFSDVNVIFFSYSLTLIDALDTLATMGNKTEFQRVVGLIMEKANFDVNINVSVFETNIRILGGLLSGHLMSKRYVSAVRQMPLQLEFSFLLKLKILPDISFMTDVGNCQNHNVFFP